MAKNVLPKHWNGSEFEELHIVTKASNVFTNDNKSVQQKIDDFTSHLANTAAHGIGDKSTLLTTNKSTIVEAINELFTFANDGKTQIANAITAKGVSASPTETFASLAEKIGQISTGKKWANGTAPATTTSSTYKKPDGTNTTARNFYSVEVNQNLGFIPSLIIVERFLYSYTIYDNRKINYEIQVYENIDYNKGTSVGAFNGYTIKNESPAYVSSSGFRLPVISDGKLYTFNWIAIE